jgi:threonine dehydrogenase-like Zn-dependent dehydrogenase
MAARVTEVGKEVAGLKAGDRIVYNAPHSQFFKFKPLPAYQAQSWVKIPEGVSDEEAPWYGLACTTQLGVRRANLQLGERVGIIGAGLLGQLVTQYLHAFGARKIIVIDPVQMRLDMAKAHGATHTLAADVKQAEGPIREITGGELLDVVFDITGSPVVLPVATTLVRKLGRVILLGDSPTPSQQFLGPRIVSDSISISGIHASMAPSVWSEFNPWTMPEMTALFFEFLLQKRMRVADLITNRYSPKEAPQVYEGLLRDRSSAMGIIFDWKKI